MEQFKRNSYAAILLVEQMPIEQYSRNARAPKQISTGQYSQNANTLILLAEQEVRSSPFLAERCFGYFGEFRIN